MRTKSRERYNPYVILRTAMEKLPSNVLESKEATVAAMVKAKIKSPRTQVGKVRMAVLRERQEGKPSSNGTTNTSATLQQLDIVLKTMRKVGGLTELKRVVSIIERVRG